MNNSRNIIKGFKLRGKNSLDARAIAEVIEEGYLNKRRASNTFTQKKTFSPSTIGYGHGTCPRYWYHAFDGASSWADTTDALGVANMSFGNHAHDEIQEILEAQGILVSAEEEIKIENPPIRGYLDAIIDWQGEKVVCEIKTTRQETFIFKETSGKPSVNHLMQILIYLKATGLQRGFLLYVNKNDQSFLVIPVELDEANNKLIEDVFDWLKTVRKAWEDQTLPERPFRNNKSTGFPENKICRGCPVRAICFEADKGIVSIPKMEVPTI